MTFRVLEHQMHALGRETEALFIAKMQAYVAANLDSFVAQIGHDAVTPWLTDALALAHAHGIDTEPEAAQLMLVLTALGSTLPSRGAQRLDWVRDALEDPTLISVGKLKRLIGEAHRRDPAIARLVVYPAYREALLADPSVGLGGSIRASGEEAPS